MATAPFDTLKLARALRDKAGFTQEHAEAAADALADAISEQVATKQDIRDLGVAIDALRSEMRTEFAAVRAEMAAEFAAVRTEFASALRDVEQRMTIKLGGMLIVLAGILLAAKIF